MEWNFRPNWHYTCNSRFFNPRIGKTMSFLANHKTKSILLGAGIAIGALAATPSFASCYFVACPNQAQPQVQQPVYQQPVYQQPQATNDGYEQGYNDGVRNSKTKVVYRYVKSSGKKAVKAKAKSTGVRSAGVVKKHKSVSKSTARHYSTKSVQNYSYPQEYVQPVMNHAANYNAAPMGQSVSAFGYMGRGDSWQQTNVTIIRYNAPQSIQYDNGRACGWGTPIAYNGQTNAQPAYVCQCAQGWLPQ
jgi:hypothetical protein